VLYAKAYGYANLEAAVPAKPEHRFEIGSITKSFAAVGIMLLVQDGKIALDEKIGAYLGSVPAAWEPITVRQLLTHTSGMQEYPDAATFKSLEGAGILSEAEMIEVAKRIPLQHAPGTVWSYSNIGYDVLGAIIRHASGKEYGAFLQERVFGPLNMRDTRVFRAGDSGIGAATGYVKKGERFTVHVQTPAMRNYLSLAASGMESTALDMAKFDAALYGNTLLTAASRAQMWAIGALVQPAASPTDADINYGLGWYLSTVDGHRKVYHSGGMPSFITDFIRYPDDGISVVVLTNQGTIGREPQQMSRYLARMFRPGLPYCCDPK
jgi:D-alanyl-D-alanine carboxypeptidase